MFRWLRLGIWLLPLFAGLSSCGIFRHSADPQTQKKEVMQNQLVEHIKNARTTAPFIKARWKITMDDGSKTQSVTASVEMVRDSAIMIAVSKFGLPVGRVLITPHRVAFYENINRTAFEGDPEPLSKRFGLPLDFGMLQEALLGNVGEDWLNGEDMVIHPVEDDRYLAEIINTNATGLLRKLRVNLIFKTCESLWQYKDTPLHLRYPGYSTDTALPQIILLNSGGKSARIEWKRVSFPKHIDIRFRIPDSYRRLHLDDED